MAVKRQGNFLGQQRVDVPHLRAIEAGVAGDFDALAGKALAGGGALVVSGFTLSNVTAGQSSSLILLNVSNGILLHSTASESGCIFTVADGTAPETFLSTNPKVNGSFAPGTTNYVGLDLLRSVDALTTDVVRFISAATATEYTQTVPLARTLDYSIVVSTTDFDSNPNLAPIAKVVTDASNNIVSVSDCRQMMFRLGTGGTTPIPKASFPWVSRNEDQFAALTVASVTAATIVATGAIPSFVPAAGTLLVGNLVFTYTSWTGSTFSGVSPNPTTTTPVIKALDAIFVTGTTVSFQGGDKSIASQHDFNRAVASRLWELGGGEFWYSASADRNVKCVADPALVFTNNENFEWDGTNLHWQGLRFLFAGSTSWFNDVTPVPANVVGLTDLANEGDCIYVDLDRTQNATISAAKGNFASLPVPTVPGSRFVLAYLTFTDTATPRVFTLLTPYPVGTGIPGHATVAAYGTVLLSANGGSDAVVPGVEVGAQKRVVAGGLSRYDNAPLGLGAGSLLIGTATADTSITIGRAGAPLVLSGVIADLTVTNSVAGTGTLSVLGNLAPAALGADVIIASSQARTAGDAIVQFKNGATLRATMVANGDWEMLGSVKSFLGFIGPSLTGLTGSPVLLLGNLAAGIANFDVQAESSVTRNAGDVIFGVKNNSVTRFTVKGNGDIGAAGSLTTNGQVVFPATQNPSTDVNTLDDYEEGTWTPSDVSGAGLSLTTGTCTYVKVGKLVTLFASVTYPVTANGAGAAIGGLPFTISGIGGGTLFRTTGGTMFHISGSNGNTFVRPVDLAGLSLTNAQMSATTLEFSVQFIATA